MKLHQNTGRAIRGEAAEQTLYELARSAQTSAQMMELEVMLGASKESSVSGAGNLVIGSLWLRPSEKGGYRVVPYGTNQRAA
jgi:hypothetical protein